MAASASRTKLSAPIGVGIVGLSATGWAASSHAPALAALPAEFKLSALSTSRDSSAKAAGEKYGVPAFTDPALVAADPNVSLVVISVKVPDHKAALWPALEAGKDVMVEWPLGRTLAEAQEMAAFAASKGVRTMVGLQARQSLVLARAKQLLADGKIGRVLSTSMIGSGLAWGPVVDQRNAYLCDASNGATLTSIPFSHTLDAFSLLLGEFEWLQAATSTQRKSVTVKETGESIPQDSPDQLVVQGQLVGGAIASIHYRGGSVSGGTDFLWEVEGEKGYLQFRGASGHLQPTLFVNGVEDVPPQKDLVGNIGRQYLAFARGDKSAYCTFAGAVQRHIVLDAVETSAREGRRVVF